MWAIMKMINGTAGARFTMTPAAFVMMEILGTENSMGQANIIIRMGF